MLFAIALIVLGVVGLAVLELWLFWRLGEREDHRRGRRRPRAPTARTGSARPRSVRSVSLARALVIEPTRASLMKSFHFIRERCPGASGRQPSAPISRLVVDLHPRAFALRYRGTPRGCSIRSRMLYRGRRGPMCCFWPSSPADAVLPVLPGETMVIAAAVLAQGHLDIVFVVVAAAFGALLGERGLWDRHSGLRRVADRLLRSDRTVVTSSGPAPSFSITGSGSSSLPLHPRRPHRYYVRGGDGGHALEAAIPSRRRHRRRDVVAVRIGARLPRWRVV